MWMRSSKVIRESDSQKCRNRNCPETGVLENPTQLSELSGVVIPAHTGYIGWTQSRAAYVDCRACTATPLSGIR
jgi:hypothetical protein